MAPYSWAHEHDFATVGVSLDISGGSVAAEGCFGCQTPGRTGTPSPHSFITMGCSRRAGFFLPVGQSRRVYGSMVLSPRLSGDASLGAARDRQASSASSDHSLRCRRIPALNGDRLQEGGFPILLPRTQVEDDDSLCPISGRDEKQSPLPSRRGDCP